MKIAVASGKGGTGKSTVSVNLAYLLSKSKDVTLIDCDVEEPNCHLFLNPSIDNSEMLRIDVPEIDNSKCTGCGKCSEMCEFNAIAVVKEKAITFTELCHGCGGCSLICPEDAVKSAKREIGKAESGKSGSLDFVHGVLRIGEAMSPPLIKYIKKKADENSDKKALQILDCPPGTSCPAIGSVDGTDYVLLVTEPTPFGLNDLILAVEMVRELGIPFSIVINRSCENDKLIDEYARNENIDIIARIPDDRRVAQLYSQGKVFIEHLKEFEKHFEPLLELAEGGSK